MPHAIAVPAAVAAVVSLSGIVVLRPRVRAGTAHGRPNGDGRRVGTT